MPTISIFFGIVIQMYWREHNPPHFHAYYQGSEGLFAIGSGELIAGSMPPAALRLIRAWAERHHGELLENWERGRLKRPFQMIVGADVE